jgi:dihydrofolate reductase
MHVLLLAVVSLDGCLTRHDAPGAGGLSSEEDTAHFRAAMSTCDASICGRPTYLEERDAVLASARAGTTNRRRVVMTRSPAVMAHDEVPGLIEFSAQEPETILDSLRADGRQRVAILGGGQVYNLFLGRNLVDEVQLTVEARVFGVGTRLAGTSSPIDPSLALQDVTRLGPNTVLLTLSKT